MNPLKKYVFLPFILLILSGELFASTANPLALPSNIEFSAAGGFNWMQTSSTYLVVSPFETDSNKVKNISNAPIWKLGVGYYAFENQLAGRSFLNHLLLGLNLYRSSATVKGDVWQYQLPQFNNYRFSAPVSSIRLMLDVKPSLFTWQSISPYPILGVGAARNNISYHETVTGSGVDPNSSKSLGTKTNTNIAYDLGAGVRMDITQNLSASLEYLYTSMGKASPSASSNSVAPLMSAPTFTLRSQSVLFGINWKI